MSLYAIADLHLSLKSNKPMDVFGGNWDNYVEKIEAGLSVLQQDDVIVICGDISWGMNMEESLLDFKFINSFGGKKIFLKGNHDYWWATVTKAKQFFEQNSLNSLDILHNNCFFYGDIALCGTRGWFFEEERGSEQDKKIFLRELSRLETSLKAAGGRETICFLHYPPVFNNYVCGEIIELMRAYGVKQCYYGHIHGPAMRLAVEGMSHGIDFRMVSADHINFLPVKILA